MKLIKTYLFHAACILLILVASCNKNREMYEPNNYNSVNSSIFSYQSVYDMIRFCDSVALLSNKTSTILPIKFTKDTLNGIENVHLNFNDTLTLHSDKRKRSGKIDYSYHIPYSTSANIINVNIINYSVNGNILNGNINYTIYPVTASQKTIIIDLTSLNLTSDGIKQKLSGSLRINKTAQYSTYLTGNLKATSDRFNYTTKLIDSLFIQTSCYIKGKYQFVNSNFEALINYGDGQKDTLATATSETFRYIVDLKKL